MSQIIPQFSPQAVVQLELANIFTAIPTLMSLHATELELVILCTVMQQLGHTAAIPKLVVILQAKL